MRTIRLVPLALVFGLAVACGGNDASNGNDAGAGGDGNGESGVSLEELPAAYSAAACQAFTSCAGDLLGIFRPGEDCLKTTRVTIEEGLASLGEAVDAGRVVYHPSLVQACLDEVADGGCDSLSRREPASCRAALEGTVATDGDCTLDAECAGERYCKLGGECPGKCAPYEPAGSACASTDNCQSGLKCDDNGHCVAPSQAGEACKQGEPDCSDGLLCLGDDAAAKTPGKCYTIAEALSGKLDDPCALDGSLCAAGYACEITSVDPISGHCVATREAGASCHAAFPDECPTDQYCLLGANPLEAGTCTAKPGAGEPCGKALGAASICAPYARCDDGVCRDIAHAGEDCHANDTCYSAHCVDGACVTGNSCN
jgi:hypothetical protein